MAAIITNDYRIFNVESFLDNLEGSTPNTYLYMFIGDSMAWNLTHPTESLSDDVPAAPVDTLNNKNFIWQNMMFLKRILRSETSHGIKKRNWTAGYYYDIYRSDYGSADVAGISLTGQITYPTSLDMANYYVVTSNGNVYICLGNNNTSTPSTSNPQDYGAGTGFNVFTSSDGYRWKFVASTSSADYTKFSTIDFHPIKNVITQPISGDPYELQYLAQENAATEGGAIYTILVKTAGTNSTYSNGTISSITNPEYFSITGDGEGLQISATFGGGGSALQKITVLNPGLNYTYCNIEILGVTGELIIPIYTPLSGLGTVPIYDLNANYMLISTKLEGNEQEDYVVDNDFRQLGLITNPRTNLGLANQDTLDACYTIVMSNPGLSFTIDAEIVDTTTGSKARVVSWTAGTNTLKVNLSRSSNVVNWATFKGFAAGDSITEVDNPLIVNEPVLSVTPPEILFNSGRIIYYENRKRIIRNALQIEDVNLVLEY